MAQSADTFTNCGTSNNIDLVLISKVSSFCDQWNQKQNRTKIDLHDIMQCFCNYKIDSSYFQNKKRKHFTYLLKQECGIKASAACYLWRIITSEENDIFYVSETAKLDLEQFALQLYSELETQNIYLLQQLSLNRKHIELLEGYTRKLIKMHGICEDLFIFNNKPIQSQLDIQSDWEDNEKRERMIFDIDCMEYGTNSASEISQ